MNENMNKADELFETNRISDALQLYEQEIKIAPNNVIAYEGAIKCLFNLKQLDRAIDLANKALTVNHNSATVHALLAEIYYDLNDIETSWREAKKSLEMDPNSLQALLTYGTFLLMDNKLEEAISLLEKATHINPDSYIARYNLSQAYLRKKDLKGHYTQSKEIFRLRPTFRKGLNMIFAFIDLVRPFTDLVILIVAVVSILTENWLLLIATSLYIAILIIGRILLNPKK